MSESLSQNNRLSVLKSSSRYAYPAEFNIMQYRPLERMSWFFDTKTKNLSVAGKPNGATIGAREALLKLAASPIGQWQSEQTARYPSYHRDLAAHLTGIEDMSDETSIEAFRLEHLKLMAHDEAKKYSTHRWGSAGVDFHPIGHMANVSVNLDTLLVKTSTEGSTNDLFLAQATRHAAALHDAGESEHPGFQLLHGGVVGDIGADIGKTSDDRKLERSILEDSLEALFESEYSNELREVITKFATHDTNGESKEFKKYHALLEVNHEINSLHTAQYLGIKAVEIANEHPQHANLMTALSLDSYTRAKNGKIEEHLVEVDSDVLRSEVTLSLDALYSASHSRDDDLNYTSWRSAN